MWRVTFPLLICSIVSGCGDNAKSADSVDPADKNSLDYERAFAQDRVGRLDITIQPADWDAMRADLTEMLGAFASGGGPSGGGGGMQLPPELVEACDGLAAGDACSATIMSMPIKGTCMDMQGALACTLSGGGFPGGGDMPPDGGVGGGDLELDHTPLYVECTVAADGESWEHVGIRFKGNSSLSASWQGGIEKLPFRLKFDEFDHANPETDKQRFFGFQSLSLSNGWSDDSLVRDKLGTDVFGEAGFDVPATAFYRVFIDNGSGPIYFGLYTVTELPSDKVFLRTHFDEDDGNLYKPEGTGATFTTFDEDTLGKENNESAADFTDVQGLFDALHADRSDAAAWRAGLERWLDVDGFLRWLAYNTVIQDWDTYGKMSHNYYLYSRTDHDGRLQWIPWDHTFAFNDDSGLNAPLSISMDEVGDGWPLIRYLLDDAQYRTAYDGYVAEAADTVYEPTRAKERFTKARALIEPYVVGDEGEQTGYTHLASPTAFTDAHGKLQEHPARRAAAVADYLAR